MKKSDVLEIKKCVRLQKGYPDFLTHDVFDMNGEIEYFLPLLCFYLEDESLADFVESGFEKTYIFTAWIRADSDDKDGDLNPAFMFLDYQDVDSWHSECIDLDQTAKHVMLETIAEQCHDACGKTLMELLEECRTRFCTPLNEKIDKHRK